MGIFDIFKKKKTDSTFPENELERTLMQASSDLSAQKRFYQKLLWNELVIPTPVDPFIKEDDKESDEDITVRFPTFDDGKIPIFTSVNRMYDKGIVKEKETCVAMKGQDLFEIAKGYTFILNPYSNYSKELIPQEIEDLMNGTIYDKLDEQAKYQEFDMIFKRAAVRQNDLIIYDGYNRKRLSSSQREKLEESIVDFKRCISIIPDHWQSMVLMAKALQRLEKHSEALEQLEIAFKIELENHTIPMEASLEAMHLQDLNKALFYSEESIKRKPNDITLLGNHAMNLLIAKKDVEALVTIRKAIQLQPTDAINKNIESTINKVIAGKRKRPSFEDTIK